MTFTKAAEKTTSPLHGPAAHTTIIPSSAASLMATVSSCLYVSPYSIKTAKFLYCFLVRLFNLFLSQFIAEAIAPPSEQYSHHTLFDK